MHIVYSALMTFFQSALHLKLGWTTQYKDFSVVTPYIPDSPPKEKSYSKQFFSSE